MGLDAVRRLGKHGGMKGAVAAIGMLTLLLGGCAEQAAIRPAGGPGLYASCQIGRASCRERV